MMSAPEIVDVRGYLDDLRVRLGEKSDRKLATRIGTSASALQLWRHNDRIPPRHRRRLQAMGLLDCDAVATGLAVRMARHDVLTESFLDFTQYVESGLHGGARETADVLAGGAAEALGVARSACLHGPIQSLAECRAMFVRAASKALVAAALIGELEGALR